jgi:hypothetical protein
VFLVVACAMLGATSLGVAGLGGDGPSVSVRAYRESLIRGGEPLFVVVTVGSLDPDLTVTLDAMGVANDGFVRRLRHSNFTFCPNEGGCLPCPADHRCFETDASLNLDYRRVGHVEVPITVTEGTGRSTRTSLVLDVRPVTDADGDGMADQWESQHSLVEQYYRESGPGDDPDRDGISNLEEYRRGTNPRGIYTRYFAEASSGDRAPGLNQCFALTSLAQPASGYPDVTRITLIGDDGRRFESSASGGWCPLHLSDHVADRVVAAIIESSVPQIVERLAVVPGDVQAWTVPAVIGMTGVEAPSTLWHFADGGTDGVLDTFYLFYNPGSKPVDVTMVYRRDDGRVLLRRVRRLEGGRRTTVWVNADDPALGRVPASTEITATAPVLVERSWRFDPPGRTVTQASASPGVAAPSTRWVFPEVDGRPGLETSIVVFNPSSREAIVDVSLLYDGQDERRAGALVIPPGGRAAIPARQLDGLVGLRASAELVSRNGASVVAERGILAHDDAGPWRLASSGATTPGARWMLPGIEQQPDIVITNVSSVAANVELVYESGRQEDAVHTSVEIPPRRRLTFPMPGDAHGRLNVTSQPTAVGLADIVVELVRRGEGDGVSARRAAGIIGGRVP